MRKCTCSRHYVCTVCTDWHAQPQLNNSTNPTPFELTYYALLPPPLKKHKHLLTKPRYRASKPLPTVDEAYAVVVEWCTKHHTLPRIKDLESVGLTTACLYTYWDLLEDLWEQLINDGYATRSMPHGSGRQVRKKTLREIINMGDIPVGDTPSGGTLQHSNQTGLHDSGNVA